MEGENITIGRLTWNNPHQAMICLDGGITDVFRNQVTLIVGDSVADSETVHHITQRKLYGHPATSTMRLSLKALAMKTSA